MVGLFLVCSLVISNNAQSLTHYLIHNYTGELSNNIVGITSKVWVAFGTFLLENASILQVHTEVYTDLIVFV